MSEEYRKKVYKNLKAHLPAFKLSEDEFLARINSDPMYTRKVFQNLSNPALFPGFSLDAMAFGEKFGVPLENVTDAAGADAGNVASETPETLALSEQNANTLNNYKSSYLASMKVSSGLGDKFDAMLEALNNPNLQVTQESWDKLDDRQKSFIALANRINKATNINDLNEALDYADVNLKGYTGELALRKRKKEFNPENSVVKALLPNQQYRREQGEGTKSQIMGGVWDALGSPTRAATAIISGATPQAQELGFLQRLGRPDPLSSEAERFADFTFGGTLSGTGIAKGAGAIARRLPMLNKVAYGGETFKDLVEAKSLADLAKQTRLGNAGRGAIRGAGRGVADAVVPATVIATNPNEEGRDWKTEAALTMLGGAAGGALLGGAGGGIVSPEAPNLLEAATRGRLAKSIGVPKQTTSEYGVNQLNAIDKLLSGKQAEIADEKAMGLDQLAQGLYGRTVAEAYEPDFSQPWMETKIADHVKNKTLRALSRDAANATPWEKETYNEVLGWFESMPTEEYRKDIAKEGGAGVVTRALKSLGKGTGLDNVKAAMAKDLDLIMGNKRIVENPITYLDDVHQRLANLSEKSDDPVKSNVYARAAKKLGETKNEVLDETFKTLEKNIPYTGPRDRTNYQGERIMDGLFDEDGLTTEDMQSTLGEIAFNVQDSEKSLAELVALQKRVPSATDQSLAKIGESRMNPIKQGNTYGQELQVKNDVLNYIKKNFSESEINQALQDAGINSLDYVADAVARELSTGSKAGKAFDPSDILNLFPSLSLTKGVAKAALRGTGGLIKGSVKQGAGTEARGLVAPRRQDAPSLQMLVKGGSVPVQAVPVTKQWANLDELYYDWKKNNK